MKTTINLTEGAVYVGTYGKYNTGSIAGKWLKLSDYSNIVEFYEACTELHDDEADPEYMFQDWENIPDNLISESWISEDVFQIIESLSDLDDDEVEALTLYIDNFGYTLEGHNIDSLIEQMRDAYQGYFDSEEDFAEHVIDECYDLPEFAVMYFDYEAFARDLFISDYVYLKGHVFNNN